MLVETEMVIIDKLIKLIVNKVTKFKIENSFKIYHSKNQETWMDDQAYLYCTINEIRKFYLAFF